MDDSRIGELVIANARDYGVIVLSESGAIESWSPGAELIFGYSPDEVIGRPGAMLFMPSDIAAGAPALELQVARDQGRAENSRWHLRKNGDRFWGNGVTMALEEPSGGFLKILRDETASKLADEQRILLLNELNHRIKNTLATVQAIADQTLRGKADDAIRRDLTARLLALSQAHDILVQQNWAAADLATIVEQALAPHEPAPRQRFVVDGPMVRVNPQQAVALSLALHELATNAIKYGALSAPTGSVAISWNVAQDGCGRRYMNLLWIERGGPAVSPPAQTGFGTRLLAKTFGAESGGRASIEYPTEGLRCVLELPLCDRPETQILDLDAARRA